MTISIVVDSILLFTITEYGTKQSQSAFAEVPFLPAFVPLPITLLPSAFLISVCCRAGAPLLVKPTRLLDTPSAICFLMTYSTM